MNTDNVLAMPTAPAFVPDGIEPLRVSTVPASIGIADLPDEVLEQLSVLPEEAPDDFECAICQHIVQNSRYWSPREYQRPPICKSCESVKGYAWHGAPRHRTKPTGGTMRDKREALRIDALADAIAQEANQQIWRARNGRS